MLEGIGRWYDAQEREIQVQIEGGAIEEKMMEARMGEMGKMDLDGTDVGVSLSEEGTPTLGLDRVARRVNTRKGPILPAIAVWGTCRTDATVI